MAEAHRHRHELKAQSFRALAWTLALVVAYAAVEVAGGLLANSLALLADAGHMLSDAAALGLALFALWVASRSGPPDRTFGYHRTEILAALINGSALLAVAVFILAEAWERWHDPEEVRGALVAGVAAGGLAVNLVGLWALRSGRLESLNVRAAWLHVLTDALGSLQALAAGLLIWAFEWHWADPLASVLIALLVLWSSWSVLRDSVNVLMEAAPRRVDVAEIRAAIVAVPGVVEVHDLHVWTITSGFDALSAHAQVAARDRDAVLHDVRRALRERFAIRHSTIQLESAEGCEGEQCD